MPGAFTQIVGEKRFYRQPVVNDTISTAAWAVQPTGPVLTSPQTMPAESIVLMEAAHPGIYLLTCTAELASGQRVKGQAKVDVIEQNV